MPPHPLMAENLGAFSVDILTMRVPKLHLREQLSVASTKVIRLFEGIKSVPSKKGCE